VYVYSIDKAGERVPLDCTSLDGLPEHPHQLGEKYGAPTIELQARDRAGAVVARVTHRTRVPVAAPAPAAPATTSSGPGFSEIMQLTNAMNERTDRFMMELVKSRDSSAAQIVDAISRMAGQRIVDSQALFETIMKTKTMGAAPAGVDRGELAAYIKGVNWAQRMVAAGAGAEGEEGVDFEELAGIALKNFLETRGLVPPPQERPRPRAVPDLEEK
jgi:hypothetical protein